jgi:DnaJ C terminal domain
MHITHNITTATTAYRVQQDTGNKLRVKGEGDAAKGAPAGDLYVFISAKSHPTFTRKGADIYADKAVQYLDAILGNDSVRVEVVDGEVEIKVPAGTQPGTHITYIYIYILYILVVYIIIWMLLSVRRSTYCKFSSCTMYILLHLL